MPESSKESPAIIIRRLLERAAVFAAVWWVVAEADPESWLFGAPFVLLATVASLKLTPSRGWRIRPLGALRYAAFFVHQSVAGGFDVALRAVRPSLPLDPEVLRYGLRLEPEHARVLLADTISLLPGTLSSGIEEDTLTMHVLDVSLPVAESMRAVEERVADLFGLDLCDTGGGIEACAIDEGGAER